MKKPSLIIYYYCFVFGGFFCYVLFFMFVLIFVFANFKSMQKIQVLENKPQTQGAEIIEEKSKKHYLPPLHRSIIS